MYMYFFLNITATPEIYTLSLHDALPICVKKSNRAERHQPEPHEIFSRVVVHGDQERRPKKDRKSTRLNSSHQIISYAVFCLKKKKIRSEFLLLVQFTPTRKATAADAIWC